MQTPVDSISASMPLLIALGVIGALVGSFIATAIERWGSQTPFIAGRSRCDHCARTLTPIELIPLISAIVLRFRCRNCQEPIGAIHWQFETAACLVGLTAGLSGNPVTAIAGAMLGWQLLALGGMDLRYFVLPNGLTATLAISGLGVSMAGAGVSPAESLLGGLAGFGALLAVKHGYRLLRNRDGLGGGDPKLFGGIGCWLGWQALPQVLLAASLLGFILAFVLFRGMHGPLATRRLPFGTCLAVAAFALWATRWLAIP